MIASSVKSWCLIGSPCKDYLFSPRSPNGEIIGQYITPREGIQDSLGFWTPRRRFRILESLSMECGFRIRVGNGIRIPWVVFRILKPGFRISQAKLSWIPDSPTYGDSYVDEIALSYHSKKALFCWTLHDTNYMYYLMILQQKFEFPWEFS